MPFSHDADDEDRRMEHEDRIFKVKMNLLWFFVTIIVVGILVLATLYLYSL